MISNNTTNWQVSITDSTAIVVDAEDIAQCIYTILTTVPGSDPLRPRFGSGVYRHIDRPMNVAQPALVLDVHEAIQQWEPRVRVDRVHVYDSGLDKKRLDIICTVLASAAQISVKIDL